MGRLLAVHYVATGFYALIVFKVKGAISGIV
jgi:hypothetical protein